MKKNFWCLFLMMGAWFVSCTSSSENRDDISVEKVAQPEFLSYKPRGAKVTIKGEFPQFDSLEIKLFKAEDFDPRNWQEEWVVDASGFELTLDSLMDHEVVYWSVLPKGDRKKILYDLGQAPIPVWVVHGAVYELKLAHLSNPVSNDTDYFSFSRNTNQEQISFLDLYDLHVAHLDQCFNSISMDVVLGRKAGAPERKSWSQARNEADEEYLLHGKADAASLWVVFNRNDHRENRAAYDQLLGNVSQQLQFSKYGVDLHNRLETIANPPSRFDIETNLKAINEQVIPFDPNTYQDKKFWLIVFWNSKDQSEYSKVTEIMKQFAENPKVDTQLLFFSLDPRLSRWRLQTGALGLDHSYFIRAEQRQALLNDWYITTTPRIILINRKGSVVEDDLQLKDLSGLSGS